MVGTKFAGMPEPIGSAPVPLAFAHAEARWTAALDAADRGAAHDAAEAFLEAAALLELEPGDPYERTATDARCLAYEYATLCYRDSGELRLAVERLHALERLDLAAAPSIHATIEAAAS
jgi:hypothetical protein